MLSQSAYDVRSAVSYLPWLPAFTAILHNRHLSDVVEHPRFVRARFPVHPHMLRHATGYKLANDGHDTRAIQQYLGHKNIQHTVRYTELSPARFRDFWTD